MTAERDESGDTIWLCTGGCGEVDVRPDLDYAGERLCAACGAFADLYVRVNDPDGYTPTRSAEG